METVARVSTINLRLVRYAYNTIVGPTVHWAIFMLCCWVLCIYEKTVTHFILSVVIPPLSSRQFVFKTSTSILKMLPNQLMGLQVLPHLISYGAFYWKICFC